MWQSTNVVTVAFDAITPRKGEIWLSRRKGVEQCKSRNTLVVQIGGLQSSFDGQSYWVFGFDASVGCFLISCIALWWNVQISTLSQALTLPMAFSSWAKSILSYFLRYFLSYFYKEAICICTLALWIKCFFSGHLKDIVRKHEKLKWDLFKGIKSCRVVLQYS